MNKQLGRIALVGTTCVGIVGTAVLSARSMSKMKDAMANVPKEKQPKTIKEKIRVYWKFWIPTAVCGASTVATVVVGHKVTVKEIAGLAAAAGVSGKSLDEIKKKVKDICGEETYQQIQQEIADDNKPEHIDFPPDDVDISYGMFSSCVTEFPNAKDTLFYDTFTKQWFKSSHAAVQAGILHLNRNNNQRGSADLKELYNLWQIPLRKDLPEDLGWECEELFTIQEMPWIDISVFKSKKKDTGEDYWIIDYAVTPLPITEMLEAEDMSKYLETKGF